ncbi:zona pellucida sperm-binding protein 3-like [Kryptolebias marmoratus]|uniref:Zona pellucida sperm-binding protein 3 n=1 Tax=Kryptolebias marmoratus TaxID=37003 RepID=A0A3Q3BQ67_KRYMA|nr:zona pellucida sperm-binding protein 3-like [Kryptolebias marmoratus]
MAILWLRICVLIGFFLSCSSLAFPKTYFPERAASLPRPQPPQGPSRSGAKQQQQQQQPQQELEKVNTVTVICHPDSLEVVIAADMFAVGAPVDSRELHLGVENNEFCRAEAASPEEYRIVVGLDDCGTKHWMTEDSLVYTNLLIYSPMPSPSGIVRMDEAVIPIECHYERKYSLSSSSLMPTWIPFTSTQSAVETLEFNLRIMSSDWMYERGANVFHLGEPINLEASVRVGHHMGLRVFLSSCVATLQPDINSDPKYIFVEDGCLVDSQLPDSKARFLPRLQEDKLQLTIEAFKFHNDDRGQLYFTCHLNAVPVNDAEALNKACTFINGRWRSADGNDYLCGYCKNQNEASTKSISGVFSPRAFGNVAESEHMWRHGLKTNMVWDHEARVGPLAILPSRKSGPLPADELPEVLYNIHRPALYGSHWRSGINKFGLKGLLPDFPPELEAESEEELKADEEETEPEKSLLEVETKSVWTDKNSTDLNHIDSFLPKMKTTVTNATNAISDLSDATDPK